MNRVKIIFGGLCVCVAFAACQRVIDIQVNNADTKLVIEGNLTDQRGTQNVRLTSTVPYNNSNNFPTVTGAVVYITDAAGNNYNLAESQPGNYTVNNFKGKYLGLYVLTVQVKGQTYSAPSLMPFAVNLDSLSITGQAFGGKMVKTVSVNYHDPAGIPNQYKFVMYVNGAQVPRIFTDNDDFNDGKAVTAPLYEQDIELHAGDKVDVDMQCIDGNIYNYWYSLSKQNGNTPADSATPANPLSNISNGALGYFSAHTLQRKSVIIP